MTMTQLQHSRVFPYFARPVWKRRKSERATQITDANMPRYARHMVDMSGISHVAANKQSSNSAMQTINQANQNNFLESNQSIE